MFYLLHMALCLSIGASAASVYWNFSSIGKPLPITECLSNPYSDEITLPIEAFGTNWRIQRFRKNVKFPAQFSLGIRRAVATAEKMQPLLDGRRITLSVGPRAYEITDDIIIPALPLTLSLKATTLILTAKSISFGVAPNVDETR